MRYAAGTPVWVQPVSPAGSRVSGVRVRVLSHAAALATGVRGVLFTAAPVTGSGTVKLGLSYARFAQVYGGNYGLALGLVELPACALTTPQGVVVAMPLTAVRIWDSLSTCEAGVPAGIP